MIFGIEPLIFWGWLFLSFYIGMMLMFGIIGMRKVKDSDDFATARGGYAVSYTHLTLPTILLV